MLKYTASRTNNTSSAKGVDKPRLTISQKVATLKKEKSDNLSEQKIVAAKKKREPEEDHDGSGFIPMKSNTKDRRSRFMKANNMKRKLHPHSSRSYHQQKQNESKNRNIPPHQTPSVSPTTVSPVVDLPVLPPNIIRSISDDKYLEEVIEQEPTERVVALAIHD